MLLKYSQIVNYTNLHSSVAISVSTALILYFSLLSIFLELSSLPGLCSPQEEIEGGTDFSSLLSLAQGGSCIKTPQRENTPEKKFNGDRSSHNFTQHHPSQPSNLLVLWIWMRCSAFNVKTVIETALFQEGPKILSYVTVSAAALWCFRLM